MITSRTIVILCTVAFAAMVGIMLVFSNKLDSSNAHAEADFKSRDVGYDQATRQELIEKGESKLELEKASEADGFRKGSLLDNLNQFQEKRRIMVGTWALKGSPGYNNVSKLRFEGNNYYLYGTASSGRENIIERGQFQVNSGLILLNPDSMRDSPKFIQLVDRRYFILEIEGDRLEFEKIS